MSAIIIDLATFRLSKAANVAKANIATHDSDISTKLLFKAAAWPDLDYNEAGHLMNTLANHARRGNIDLADGRMPTFFERLAQNFFQAQKSIQEIETRMIRAEKRLGRRWPGLKGRDLAHAIRHGKPPKRLRDSGEQADVG